MTAALLKLSAARRMMARYENDQIRLEEKKQEAMSRLEEVGRLQKQLENEMGGHQKALSAASGELADKKAQAEQLRGDCRVQEENLKHASEELKRLTEHQYIVSPGDLLSGAVCPISRPVDHSVFIQEIHRRNRPLKGAHIPKIP